LIEDEKVSITETIAKQNTKGTNENKKSQIQVFTPEQKQDGKLNVGLNWQDKFSTSTDSIDHPDISEEGALALLSTNEILYPEGLKTQIGESDGYICGVGFGNILSLVTLYEENNPPKGILSIDLSPEVVLTGRIATELIKTSENFEVFKRNLMSGWTLGYLKRQVIKKESSPKIKNALENVSLEKISQTISRENSDIPEVGVVIENRDFSRISVLAVIRDNFKLFKKLANEGNIGISLASATDPDTIRSFSDLPEFNKSKNLIYLTNIIDHITTRGTRLGLNNHLLDTLKPYELLNNGLNHFIDTTQAKNYILRANSKPPIYTKEDVQIKF